MFLKFSRDNESESDKLGATYSTKIGYDAHEMADFFTTLKRLSDGSGSNLPTFLSTHPDPTDRNGKVMAEATKLQEGQDPSRFKVNRDSYLRMIDGLIYGNDPKQGFTEGNVFYHPELKFEFKYPSGYSLANTPTQVQIASPDGKGLMVFGLAQGTTMGEAKANVIKNNALTVINENPTTVNGFPAHVLNSNIAADQQTGQQALKVMTYLIQYDGKFYFFHGLSAMADFNTYSNAFQSTFQSFKTLTAQDKLNRQPTYIKIATATQTSTLRNLLTKDGIPAGRFEEIAILNGMKLEDNLSSGQLYKILSGRIN